MGGLGNQMFQYAFARSLSLRKHTNLSISRKFLRNDGFNREYSLDKLSIPKDESVKLMTYPEELLTHARFYVIRKLRGEFFTDKYIYFRDSDRYEPEIMSCDFGGVDIIVQGYFQAARYFADNQALIKHELRVSKPPSPENARLIHELEGCESVCVHFRRGDYLALKSFNVCGHEYYSRAMKYIAGRVKSPVFYFFSNTHEDICWLRKNYSFPGFEIKYVDLDNPDYEELRLMYSCKNFIIANSSLSWWGSYLCVHESKIICAPSFWNTNMKTEDSNIFLPCWEIINV